MTQTCASCGKQFQNSVSLDRHGTSCSKKQRRPPVANLQAHQRSRIDPPDNGDDGPSEEPPTIRVTIPPLDPSTRDEGEPDYDEEAQVWAAAMEHAAEVEDEETPDEYDWQISRLVSAATYTAGPDAGRVSTGRMKITRSVT